MSTRVATLPGVPEFPEFSGLLHVVSENNSIGEMPDFSGVLRKSSFPQQNNGLAGFGHAGVVGKEVRRTPEMAYSPMISMTRSSSGTLPFQITLKMADFCGFRSSGVLHPYGAGTISGGATCAHLRNCPAPLGRAGEKSGRPGA